MNMKICTRNHICSISYNLLCYCNFIKKQNKIIMFSERCKFRSYSLLPQVTPCQSRITFYGQVCIVQTLIYTMLTQDYKRSNEVTLLCCFECFLDD